MISRTIFCEKDMTKLQRGCLKRNRSKDKSCSYIYYLLFDLKVKKVFELLMVQRFQLEKMKFGISERTML